MDNNDLIDNGQLTIDNANNNCPLSILNCQLSMVDLHRQYLRLKPDVDRAMQQVLESTAFINGPQVKEFATNFANYLNIPYVIPCGNGTDALQIALMALDLRPGDEVIVPAFTYVAAAEVVALLGLIPVWVDVEPGTFNINPSLIEGAVSPRTKAIVAVHLFGQSCDMEPILRIASQNNLYVIEDNAQSVGAVYTFSDGTKKKTGTMGHIGTTSFFPSKPLACYGDGGAIMTSDSYWAERLRMIASHGQQIKYHHKIVGCNSRLDTLQAAVLDVKLKYLDQYTEARQAAAARYDRLLADVEGIVIPARAANSTHVFHQYTLRVPHGRRDALKAFLAERGIPSMIYYPVPLHLQKAYANECQGKGPFPVAERLSGEVLSVPMHTELDLATQEFIADSIRQFFVEN